jgi:hypothetical protein
MSMTRHNNPFEHRIVIPSASLAASFYWYERDPDLLAEEKQAMRRFFPQFQLEQLPDNRLAWYGSFDQSNIRPGAIWHLQAIYEHNHPSNSTYGGSVKVYSIDPDLDEFYRQYGYIPHILSDSAGQLYICTSRGGDFRASVTHSTSAASALGWAAKWIAAFELWTLGELSDADFAGHRI